MADEQDERFAIDPAQMPKVGDEYRFAQWKLYHVRGIVDDQVICRRWYGNRYGYYVYPAWMFMPRFNLFTREK